MTSTTRTRVRIFRRIGADPTSTALLLAGPTALELWPGVRRVGEVGGRALVEAELSAARAEDDSVSTGAVSTGAVPTGAAPTAASVTAWPPRRTPTAFVTRFSWSGPGLPGVGGVLTLTYAPGGEGTSATGAELVLDVVDLADSRLDEAGLTGMAEGFLANLAHAAEQRRQAA